MRKKTSTSGPESDEVERIVGSKTLSTLSRELSNIIDSPVLTVLHTVVTSLNVKLGAKREHGSLRQLLACERALCLGEKLRGEDRRPVHRLDSYVPCRQNRKKKREKAKSE